MKLICYPKCSTCQKAQKHLESKKLVFEKRHIVEEKLSMEELKEIYEKSGLDIKKMFNTSGNMYKELNLKDRLNTMTLEEKLELLSTNGMLVKRPILLFRDNVIIGYDEEKYNNI
ncbi:Spx/MgsR family RNA polymerase-binding regulatory protein [Streptobacillus felis]|uniref:Spx/MgsR family RNA polymerase-binding regulatory protein n=1 Tax=Streptobacillus felis TaxID=1384509 RepID=A0A7Z0PEH8_9FUSO|nr:Spx/MgsR family RNA polymerase-binding regulatory protein [Streptobacillus felis]NYV27243.1 Spx/MgsR family RNA polymerase-binding regulatory protein [Streptobacillus felis]